MSEVREALHWGEALLSRSGLESPVVEVEAILSGLLKVSRTQMRLNTRLSLSLEVEDVFKSLLNRRLKGEPVAYLLGEKNFFGFDFKINPSVLIPRPETELLVEAVLKALIPAEVPERGSVLRRTGMTLLEVGTGSGCISISLARKTSSVAFVATDISEEALSLARWNAERHSCLPKIEFLKSDLYRQLGPYLKGYFDIIVSNPPYISSSKINQLDPDLQYEPRLALDGGEDGLTVIKPLIEKAANFLKPSGKLMIEIGFDQGDAVSNLYREAGFEKVQILKDLNQHDRIAIGTNSGSV